MILLFILSFNWPRLSKTKKLLLLNSPNFSQWKDVPLRHWVEEDFGKPATVNNDAKCAMFTEFKLGNAVGTTNAILLTFGTGVGGGLILNKQL